MNEKNSYRIIVLDWLKAIAIFFVIATHINLSSSAKLDILFPFWGYMAVPVFLIISGYVYALSMQRNHITRIGAYFAPNFFLPKALRILVPFFVFLSAEMIFFDYPLLKTPLFETLKLIVSGGFLGSGNYYNSVLFQFLILFPFLYFLSKKKEGILTLILIQLILTFIMREMSTSEYLQRLLIIRFLVFVLAGILLARYQIKFYWVLLSAFIGGTYIYIENYTAYEISFFSFWKNVSMPTVLYAVALVYFPLYFQALFKKQIQPFSLIGQASFHIFLAQTFFFTCIRNIFLSPLSNFVHAVLFSCVVGITFYELEKYIRNFLKEYFL